MRQKTFISSNTTKTLTPLHFLTLLIAFLVFYSTRSYSQTKSEVKIAAERFLSDFNEVFPVNGKVTIKKVDLNIQDKKLDIYFNSTLAYIPIRTNEIARIKEGLEKELGENMSEFEVEIYIEDNPINTFIPNFYREINRIDSTRLPVKSSARAKSIVKNTSKPYITNSGLSQKNIALWHSHGWYYEPSLNRWEWQRARAFQTVEDLLPMSFVLPYLTPMLENAGANIFIPRERDWQTNEVIVDNDSDNNKSFYEISLDKKNQWKTGKKKGFGVGDGIYEENETPFALGTYKYIETADEETASAQWIPEIPENGNYAVYITYQSSEKSSESAYYTVRHSGGETIFKVNQKIGGGTWIYLGSFNFSKGQNKNEGAVLLSNFSTEEGKIITADAVKFGGGMGNVSRNGQTSGYPRFLEASRYYFQYAGIHDTLVYHLNENDDYRDDYQSRGEWVNYLKGAPFGPNKDRDVKGLGIPIDLSLAFHTDAGFTRNDTVIGTLMIHSTAADEGYFPNGISRMANRDFADILQTQIVEDLRLKYDSAWTRRGLWDKDYSEAFRPNVPSALLELISHHNFQDMKFALDPRFRFDVSRSMYKGILKYLSNSFGEPYVVQPLPVTHFSTEFISNNRIRLSWKPILDSLETSSKPDGYVVYKAIGDSGFDNGTYTNTNEIIFDSLDYGIIYRYKVTAVNDGGESLPSEILSVGLHSEGAPTALVVNAFDRVCAPASINSDQFMGFTNFIDEGVPYIQDISFVGEQYDFDPDSPWLDDDAPGHGASHSDYETQVIAGNTFNFPFTHGKAILSNGYSFVSTSEEVIEENGLSTQTFTFVDWILGEEKSTPQPKYVTDTSFRAFPELSKKVIKSYLNAGGKLFISGAYIGTDLSEGKPKKHADVKFANEVLKMKWRANHASKEGFVKSVHEGFSTKNKLKFSNSFNNKIYKVEAPDAIEPFNAESETILRYSNSKSAGVGYNGKYSVVSLGFPFETILDEKSRTLLMRDIINYLNKQN